MKGYGEYMVKPISEKISELRKARSLTQEKLGEQLGISSQAISKWEKGESMPDIMILPKLCEILGITVDALLEVPLCVKKDSCMKNLSEYSREIGTLKATFEAFQACTGTAYDRAGSALMANDGVQIYAKSGLGIVITGEEQLNSIVHTDIECVKKICFLLQDENVLKVIQTLDFNYSHTEKEISEISGLNIEIVEGVLFRLMKHNFCECDSEEKYSFGIMYYALLAILSGMWLLSSSGHRSIQSISKSFNSAMQSVADVEKAAATKIN